MKYQIVPVTAFSQNCTLLWCEKTNEAAIVDPGGDAEKIKRAVADAGISVKQILLTHGHLDHVGAAAELAEHYQVAIIGPQIEDAFWLEGLPAQSRMFGLEECAPLTSSRCYRKVMRSAWVRRRWRFSIAQAIHRATLFSLMRNHGWHR